MSRHHHHHHEPSVSERFQVERRVPLALFITLFCQVAAALIWVTQLDARVESLEQKTVPVSGVGERLARIEERLESTKQDTETIKRHLEAINARLLANH